MLLEINVSRKTGRLNRTFFFFDQLKELHSTSASGFKYYNATILTMDPIELCL